MKCDFCDSENSEGAAFCARCGSRLEGAGVVTVSPDWEENGGWFRIPSFFITVREVLFTPSSTFSRVKTDNRIFNACLFGIIGGSIGILFGSLWQTVVDWRKFIPQYSDVPDVFHGLSYWLAMLLIAPSVAVLAQLISAGIVHVCLMIAGGAKRGFAVTFRVVAYAYGATALLSLIPVLGAVAGFIWLVAVEALGLKEAHRITLGKSLFAVFLPFVFCCFCCAVIVGGMVFAGISLAGLTGLFTQLK